MSDSPFPPVPPPALPGEPAPVAAPVPSASAATPETASSTAPASQAAAASAPAEDQLILSRKWLFLLLGLAAAGVVTSTLLWQKLGNIQEELARRSQDSGAQAIEARTLARAAQDSTLELTARLALQETRISEVSLQRTQLEDLMQSLSRSRDENLVVDIESAIRLAQQQALLTGSAEPLIAALRSADQRLQRAAQPRLNPLQRAIAKDTDRIKAASLTDVPVLMLKIDELSRMTDELPLANAMVSSALMTTNTTTAVVSGTAAAPETAASAARAAASAPRPSMLVFDRIALPDWSQRALGALRDEAHKLLRVSRIDQPEAALLSPEQSFFLRENLKLRLLNARLGLLARQTETARSDLQNASIWLAKYFDPASRKTQAAIQLLQQVQGQLKTSELPRLDDTMTALATAAAGR